MRSFFKKYHKWIGLFACFFIIMFAFSGIVLNHRKALSHIDIPRSVLPASYHYSNWNNGAVRGTIRLGGDSVLLYGSAGMLLSDTLHTSFSEFNSGLSDGADNRIVSRVVSTPDSQRYAITTFDLYRLGKDNRWESVTTLAGIDERLSDLTVKGDTLVVLTRSKVYQASCPYTSFSSHEISAPEGYEPEVSLFRTFWLLHSGELFGLPGQIFVDILGILLIVLSLTGLAFTFIPKLVRYRRKKQKAIKSAMNALKLSIRWHNKIGVLFLIFFLVLGISGTFLRPPLLIAIIRSNVKPIPGSVLDDPNPWRDKLRNLRYDADASDWILYTSSGFFSLASLDAVPKPVAYSPPVSVMGINSLESVPNGWSVGSFSGLYVWDRANDVIVDHSTGAVVPKKRKPAGRPVFYNQVSGYSRDFALNKEVIFRYDKGADSPKDSPFAEMPALLKKGRLSLWHTCLEIHVGRAYSPVIGPFSDLFIFLFGLLFIFLLISGYIVYRRSYKKKRKKSGRERAVS
ncbi:MAG: PepSY-associated TM helix domain-containing protein [Porphyromonas sp.]|nr:PepSY-associated TM helix domain-containing protein [Porphyromonas sp.]